MKFKKLEISGFKSFSEKTTFLIQDGLTGIVGPNGCGKSNIVESLRWCMGESSAKSMRGSGMEDVIFSGTSNKPSKNISEVALLLDNKDKDIFVLLGFTGSDRIYLKHPTYQNSKPYGRAILTPGIIDDKKFQNEN